MSFCIYWGVNGCGTIKMGGIDVKWIRGMLTYFSVTDGSYDREKAKSISGLILNPVNVPSPDSFRRGYLHPIGHIH